MLGLGLGVDKIRPSGGFDTDYQAVLDYATTQAYTLPSAGQQILQNQLVVDLKAAGVWAKLDAFSVFATDGDSDFALIDWVRLVTQTAISSPTFTTNQGYSGDGISSYINTGLNLVSGTNNYTLNSASLFRYKFSNRTIGTSGTYDGARSSGPSTFTLIGSENGSNTDNYVNTDSFGIFFNVANTLGFHLNTRSDANVSDIYLNGSLEVNMATTSLAIPNTEYFIGGYSNAGSLTFPHNAIESIHGIGADLSLEQADLNTAIQTYMTSI